MVEYKKGNLLESEAEALVNTVNCAGVMGKGIALQFKQAFPDNFKEYEKACKNNLVMPGKMFIFDTGSLFNPRYIINFPTKRHWRGKSKIEDIESGLTDLIMKIREYGIKSVAIPPLGCGNGGLDWNQVRPLIEKYALKVPDVLFSIYPPIGSPDPDKMLIGTNKPVLTRARALLIKLMNLYAAPGYKLSMLEIQKIAYFLQECGEELKLSFVKAQYGPYAENLNHVLQRIEGHYIRGYGDRNRDAEIYLLPEALNEAEEYLGKLNEDSLGKRLHDTKRIIEGFETPYGLELLATTDWIIKHYPDAREDVNRTVSHFINWNERKRKVFAIAHIEMAWRHLTQIYTNIHPA